MSVLATPVLTSSYLNIDASQKLRYACISVSVRIKKKKKLVCDPAFISLLALIFLSIFHFFQVISLYLISPNVHYPREAPWAGSQACTYLGHFHLQMLAQEWVYASTWIRELQGNTYWRHLPVISPSPLRENYWTRWLLFVSAFCCMQRTRHLSEKAILLLVRE